MINKLTPKKALTKAFLKVKPIRSEIDDFKKHLIQLLDRTNDTEREEFHKNLVMDFLKNTYYKSNYFINTKEWYDLVIHNGDTVKSSVGVIFEVKRPNNKGEMLRPLADGDNHEQRIAKLNVKAFQELVLYYLRERITNANENIKHLIITNIHEWFIFDATIFYRLFAQNKELVDQFKEFEGKRLEGIKTDYFYKKIAEPFIAAIKSEIEYTYFNLQDYQKPLRNEDKKDDNKLIALFKLLSPEHLLKLPFVNDSNTLDKRFYSELLHIIGLNETKESGKKLIGRNKEGERNTGSILEDAIIQLDSSDKISQLESPSKYGNTNDERLFNVALELSITWMNRILFLKLLEAQLLTYHKDDASYAFLNLNRVKSYDDLNSLFFQVLAKKQDERNTDVKHLFEKVPYLNSSLFEPSDIEHKTLLISNLKDDKNIPIISTTVLKNQHGKKRTGGLPTLQYLFEFLEAYDFSSESSEKIQEDNKTLINASVLGLIFEKINGYKDGSFFTPGFITMYMCRETIRKAVLQKFNETKGWNCTNFDELHDEIKDRNEANDIINSIKICDPAVGSGHFLVSALNEIIAVKNDLNILQDRRGRRLKEYQVIVENDELIVTDEDGDFFEYRPHLENSKRVQEALFHEKQTIIENCLFGVDINQNSVKICRLRLWIELLKNAYYKNDTELETLPNIDINIKRGNSLVSRFDLNADLKDALKKSKWTIDRYRNAVGSYRNAENKEHKWEMKQLIRDIKNDFKTNIDTPLKGKLSRARGKKDVLSTEINTKKQWGEKIPRKSYKDLEKAIDALIKLEAERNSIENNRFFVDAFEWRFEFPEVLNEVGDFVGFDVVIGNPPYGVNFNKENGASYEKLYKTFNWRGESYVLFIERAASILKKEGYFGYIIPDTLLNLGFTEGTRSFILKHTKILEVDLLPTNVFSDASVDTILLFFQKFVTQKAYNNCDIKVNNFSNKITSSDILSPVRTFVINSSYWYGINSFNLQSDSKELEIIQRVDNEFAKIKDIAELFSGIKVYEVGKGIPSQTTQIRDTKPFTSKTKETTDWLPFYNGKDIGYYSLLWKENSWINYGPWLAAPRSSDNFEGEKILIRKITSDKLIAHYIPYTSYCNTLLFVLKLKLDIARISYKAMLGILNSNFIGWYFRKKFQIMDEDTFPQIMIRDIEQFAIPNQENILTDSIEQKVEQIIEHKKSIIEIDTSALEAQIDQLVYQLYDLTEEEIEIIETN